MVGIIHVLENLINPIVVKFKSACEMQKSWLHRHILPGPKLFLTHGTPNFDKCYYTF